LNHRNYKWLSPFIAAASLSACASMGTSSPTANASMNVKEVGSFHIGGRTATLSGMPIKDVQFTPSTPVMKVNPNGEFEVEQMYVQYVKLEPSSQKAVYPLIMMHGGGLSGVTWETKPDGKPGWQMSFLRAGHDVYVADSVERGRSSWARYPEIFKSEPIFRTKKEAWELFRFGPRYEVEPAVRQAHAGTQFPVEHFDQMMKQGVPRWLTNNASTQAAYDAMVEKVCPCVLMPHSQGSTFAFAAANKYPQLVKAVVAIEPSGAIDAEKVSIANLKNTPLLFVWGDNIRETPQWVGIVAPLKKMMAAQQAQGGVADEIDLPLRGIKGNTHMLMMDKNSDEIATLVNQWMVSKGLTK
jgi:pimeloyl-ACP methyl ester carboxylesterase